MYSRLNVDYNPEHRLAICRPKGLLDGTFARLLLDFLLAVEEDPSQHPFIRLLDLVAIDEVHLTSRDVSDYSSARRAATNHLPHFRTAIVAPTPFANGTARFYETLMQGSKIEVGVFWDHRAAAEWLGVPVSVLMPAMT